MDELIYGVKLGVILSVIISPTLLIILYYSINYGKNKGLILCLGLWTSDILHALVFTFGENLLSSFLGIIKSYYTLVSVIILLFLGVKILFTPVRPFTEKEETSQNKWYNYYSKGLLLAIFNPGSTIVWLGIIGISGSRQYDYISHFSFISGIIFTVIFFDFLKIILANGIKNFLSINLLNIINRIIGVLLLIGACVMLYRNEAA